MTPLTATEVATQIKRQQEELKAKELAEVMSTEAFSDIYAAVSLMLDSNMRSVRFDTGSHPFGDLKMAIRAMKSLGYAVEVVVPEVMRAEASHLAIRVTVSIPEDVV